MTGVRDFGNLERMLYDKLVQGISENSRKTPEEKRKGAANDN